MTSKKDEKKSLETTEKSSTFTSEDNIRRLEDLQVFKTSQFLYKSCKENKFVGTGIGILEKGAGWFSAPALKGASAVSRLFPQTASSIASKVVDIVGHLDKSYTKILESTNQKRTFLEVNSKKYLDNCLHKVVGSFPGTLALQVGDLVINIMETVVDKLANEKGTQCGDVKPKEKSDNTIEVIRPHRSIERLAVAKPGILGKITWLVVRPFKFLLDCLKYIRSKLVPYESTKSVGTMTPASLATLAKRRRLSPRKRLGNRSFLNRFFSLTLSFLGVRKIARFPENQINLAAAARIGSHDVEGVEKRTYSDVSEESISEMELDYLQDEFEDYVSEEDPDFEPPEEPSEDSFEYQEGDSESFIDLDDENASPVKLLLSSPGRVATRSSLKKKGGKTKDGKLDAAKSNEKPNDKENKGKENQGSEKIAKPAEKLTIIKEEAETKPVKKEVKITITKSDKTAENKENEQPKPKVSPNKGVLRPQNTSSPILKPEWKKFGTGNKQGTTS